MAGAPPTPAPASGERFAPFRSALSFGDWRAHVPSLAVFLLGCAASGLAFLVWSARQRDAQRGKFNLAVAPIVANLRSSLELPLEVLEATTALFAASERVTRAEFGRFVRPALERFPGIRALEWVPVVPGGERQRYELEARADGVAGFAFRESAPGGGMMPAAERAEYLPVYFMEPGHPLVFGFDCVSEPLRHATAERARSNASMAASERIRLFEDPPSVYSIAVFQPVFDPTLPHLPGSVRGFTVEVFRVRSLAERALAESARQGIRVSLIDLDAAADTSVLYETAAAGAALSAGDQPLRFETPLRFADSNWKILLESQQGLVGAGVSWLVLLAGIGISGLLAFGLAALQTIRGLRAHIRETQQLGQYTLLERLGEGGMGVVYKARHAMLRRPTAIKLLQGPDQDPLQLARFEREVQLTSELSHPNTIAIYDYGRTPAGVFYYAMEYIEGLTLEQLVEQEGPLPAARVVHLLRQVASALTEAHAAGLIHRDIKPANVMLCQKGGVPDFIKVMDFGLVKDIGTPRGANSPRPLTLSASAALLGTPSYLAPEAISTPAELDARADLYALGAVAYFLLAGVPVFTGQTIMEVCGHHLYTAPRPPSELAPVPASLEALVLRCLAKNASQRFASAAALLGALSELHDTGSWTEADARSWWQARGDTLLRALRSQVPLGHARTAAAP
jgi:CHASE1-domain containing sensor protein